MTEENNDGSAEELTKGMLAKQSMERLVHAIGLSTASKEGIAEIAKEVSDAIVNPLVSTVAIKPIEEFLAQVKLNLKDKAIEEANTMADSQKTIGKISYRTATKETKKFNDERLEMLTKQAKARKDTLTKNGEYTSTHSPYIAVTIPKV